jgi:hypothetical protein
MGRQLLPAVIYPPPPTSFRPNEPPVGEFVVEI